LRIAAVRGEHGAPDPRRIGGGIAQHNGAPRNSARAQVSIEVSKITCDEYVHDKIPTSDVISFPAVGSLVARAMLLRWPIATLFEDNVNKLTNYSYDEKNFEVPLMEAIERVLGK
jgi:hypothetical protein